MEILYPLEMLLRKDERKDNALTVLINRTISAEEEEAFLKKLKVRLDAFNQEAGTRRTEVFLKKRDGKVELSIMMRFASEAAHDDWLKSEEFRNWQRDVATQQTAQVHRYSGVESLFVSAKAPKAPPQWKMAAVLMLAVFPMSLTLSCWGAPMLAHIPPLAGTLITTPLMVVVMTYVMVPILTKVFAGWLQPG